MKHLSRIALVMALALIALVSLSEAGPTTELQAQMDQMFRALGDPELKGPDKAEARRAAIFAIAQQIFDFGHAARLTLGAHWDALTPAQRDEFVQLFQRFIERAYFSNLDSSAGGEKVQYTNEAIEGDRALVRARFMTSDGGIPVDFRMRRHDERWRLYDVNVEGMSLVGNYRQQFQRLIRTSSYDALVKSLRDRQ